ILLVDDEPMVRTLGRTILEAHGYRVVVAEDGLQAVERYRREQGTIDLIVLDLTMPRLSGRDTFKRLVQLDSEVRVLFASGYAAEQAVGGEYDLPCDFISKPYRPQELAARVRAALDRGRVWAGTSCRE